MQRYYIRTPFVKRTKEFFSLFFCRMREKPYLCPRITFHTTTTAMVKVRKYSSEEEFHQAIKAAIAKKELVYQMLRAGATRAEMEAAGIHMAPVGE